MSQIIKRDRYLDKLVRHQFNGRVKVITGIRRCGKSFLLNRIFADYLRNNGVREEEIIGIDLDSDIFYHLRNPLELGRYVREKVLHKERRYYLFVDEIQMSEVYRNPDLPEGKPLTFYDTLNGLLKIGNLDIYVTGSNSKMLSRDILTEFRGRGDPIQVHPLTFAEYFSTVSCGKREALEDYLHFGGMPYLAFCEKEEEKEEYLRWLFAETYLKDIRERNSVERLDVLEGLIDMLCSAVGSLTNPSRIARAMEAAGIDCNANTVTKYLGHLGDAYLFREFRRYDITGRRYLDFPNKYYCADTGLRNARIGFRQEEISHLVENVICNEILARGFSADIGSIESNERSADGKYLKVRREIDFVVRKSHEIVYVQSAYAIPDEEKRRQETLGFMKIRDSFRKIIVRGDVGRRWYDDCGFLNVSYTDFLLDDSII